MSDLTSLERIKLERLLEMSSGYVLDFSNRTFEELILENTGVEIYGERYANAPGSKANRLRAFWKKESNDLVAKLLESLLDYWKVTKSNNRLPDLPLYTECLKIVQRLRQESVTGQDLTARIPKHVSYQDAEDIMRKPLSQNKQELLRTYEILSRRLGSDFPGSSSYQRVQNHLNLINLKIQHIDLGESHKNREEKNQINLKNFSIQNTFHAPVGQVNQSEKNHTNRDFLAINEEKSKVNWLLYLIISAFVLTVLGPLLFEFIKENIF